MKTLHVSNVSQKQNNKKRMFFVNTTMLHRQKSNILFIHNPFALISETAVITSVVSPFKVKFIYVVKFVQVILEPYKPCTIIEHSAR